MGTQRLVVLVSGSGTNLAAIMDACSDGRLAATVVAVVANKRDAFALTRATDHGIPALLLERLPGEERADYDTRLVDLVAPYTPDLVVLAGWMRILTPVFVTRFPVINLHPALPGRFPGAHAIDDAFAAWQSGEITESGVMVHWVPDAAVDAGPVILSEAIAFEPGDTLETFEARVHTVEHRVIVEAVDLALRATAPSASAPSASAPSATSPATDTPATEPIAARQLEEHHATPE